MERLRRELLAEAREAARGVPDPERERLLVHVAAAMGRHLGFGHGAAAADEPVCPLRRAGAWAALARSAHGDAAVRRARSRLRQAAKALVQAGAPDAEAGRAGLGRVVERLAEAGDLALAGRLCARFPDYARARDSLLGALLSAGHRREALDLARLDVRVELSGAEGPVAVRAIRGRAADDEEREVDAAGAARALRQVLPELRDEMAFRDLAIEQLRHGDEAGAAAGSGPRPAWAAWPRATARRSGCASGRAPA